MPHATASPRGSSSAWRLMNGERLFAPHLSKKPVSAADAVAVVLSLVLQPKLCSWQNACSSSRTSEGVSAVKTMQRQGLRGVCMYKNDFRHPPMPEEYGGCATAHVRIILCVLTSSSSAASSGLSSSASTASSPSPARAALALPLLLAPAPSPPSSSPSAHAASHDALMRRQQQQQYTKLRSSSQQPRLTKTTGRE